jgi:hypothetical protein
MNQDQHPTVLSIRDHLMGKDDGFAATGGQTQQHAALAVRTGVADRGQSLLLVGAWGEHQAPPSRRAGRANVIRAGGRSAPGSSLT